MVLLSCFIFFPADQAPKSDHRRLFVFVCIFKTETGHTVMVYVLCIFSRSVTILIRRLMLGLNEDGDDDDVNDDDDHDDDGGEWRWNSSQTLSILFNLGQKARKVGTRKQKRFGEIWYRLFFCFPCV